ncbi:hypothetical protein NVP1079O_64 [Vibrio phage 1.079.O._10N.286.45.E9]|nr:hypothetical protein NVP1079O_64 [Vibrio phage 1.079.O._10N.286.45.E9]
MKHKHYEMIVAKAANMDLVVFLKSKPAGWVYLDPVEMPIQEDLEFFLCLPQHKDACLHWLNGGVLFANTPVSEFKSNDSSWGVLFRANHPMLQSEWSFKLAPKKEKRWIVVNPIGNSVNVNLMKTAPDMSGYPDTCQLIEIEVEV